MAPGFPSEMQVFNQKFIAGKIKKRKGRGGKKTFSYFTQYQILLQVYFRLAHSLFWVYQHILGNEMHICWSALIYPEGLVFACVCFKLKGVVKLFQQPRDEMIRHGRQRLFSGWLWY